MSLSDIAFNVNSPGYGGSAIDSPTGGGVGTMTGGAVEAALIMLLHCSSWSARRSLASAFLVFESLSRFSIALFR